MTTPQSSQQRIPCPSCGTMNPANAQFCGNCGANVQAAQQAPVAQTVAPSFQQPNWTPPQQPSFNPPQPTFNPPQPNWNQPQPNPQPNWTPPQPNFNQQQPNWNQPQPNFNQPQPNWNQQQAWAPNPYAQTGVVYGGFWVRVRAIFIDAIIMYAIMYVVGPYLGFFAGAAYYIGCWGAMSSTLGMKLFRLRIVDANTMQNIDYKKAAIRYLGFIVDGLTLGIGFLMALWDPRAQCIHDKIAGTLVIRG